VAAKVANNVHRDYGSGVGQEWLLSLVRDTLSSVSEEVRCEAVVKVERGLENDRDEWNEIWEVLPPPSNWDYTDSSSPAPVLFDPNFPLQGQLKSYQELCCKELVNDSKEWVETIISKYHSLVIPSANPDEAASGMSFVIMHNPKNGYLLARILMLATHPDHQRKGHASRLLTALEKVAVAMATKLSADYVVLDAFPNVLSPTDFFEKKNWDELTEDTFFYERVYHQYNF
jgi:GNAT superfamily N-acetyltransferase